ncbi:(2Fe-2S) ferredoxin domain-containing protein [Evansella sp. AB-P1]|uniref:(2Fe-2S) ferredoxin domain-containing protein n=1 Tax=Evansella sp. AB-P1 TaxID=3037653 RepID=UPI00241FB962|nr:(2Fe-2S) ferredoxin domain-containing protein [Evansella sp. AB-P1]MDG5785899.1 (2Fe-2S) ferredoxin domain-containing protein [Evansella sp. AB-P1]
MATWDLRDTQHHLLICNGGSCTQAGAEQLVQAVRTEIGKKGLDDRIHTSRTLCNGRCQDKCVLISYPDGYWYKEMTSEDVPEFIESLITGELMEEKLSLSFNGNGFQPTKGTFIGLEKERETVEKVSKKL